MVADRKRTLPTRPRAQRLTLGPSRGGGNAPGDPLGWAHQVPGVRVGSTEVHPDASSSGALPGSRTLAHTSRSPGVLGRHCARAGPWRLKRRTTSWCGPELDWRGDRPSGRSRLQASCVPCQRSRVRWARALAPATCAPLLLGAQSMRHGRNRGYSSAPGRRDCLPQPCPTCPRGDRAGVVRLDAWMQCP